MTPIKIDKRVKEQTDSIRNRVLKSKTLNDGDRNAILNRLEDIEAWARKAGAQLERGHYRTAAYDARTNEDIAAQARCKKAVFEAMLGGRHVDLRNSKEFRIAEMHTAIHQIRRDIERKHPDLVLCDEWLRLEGSRPFKSYWIERTDPKLPLE